MTVEIRERCGCGAEFAVVDPIEGWTRLEEWRTLHEKVCSLLWPRYEVGATQVELTG